LAVVFGGKILAAPIVKERVTTGSVEISGGFTSIEAAELAMDLRAGAAPAPFKLLELKVMNFSN
jgi:preprotein translocase subunit SecD